MISFFVVGGLGTMMLIAAAFSDELWIEDDGDVSAWISPRAVSVFMVMYGAFGALIYHSGKAGLLWSSVFAFAWSVIVTVFIISVMNWCLKQACTTTTGEIVGRRGTVSYLSEDAKTMMVATQIGELQEEFIARSNEPLHEGDVVEIIDRNGSVCLVKRAI